MGPLLLSHQRGDLIAVVELVTQRVENLRIGQSQSFGDLGDRFAAQMKGRDVADADAKLSITGSPPQTPSSRTMCGCSVLTVLDIPNLLDRR